MSSGKEHISKYVGCLFLLKKKIKGLKCLTHEPVYPIVFKNNKLKPNIVWI